MDNPAYQLPHLEPWQHGWQVYLDRFHLGWIYNLEGGGWIADLDNGNYLEDEFISQAAAISALMRIHLAERTEWQPTVIA